MKINAHTKVSEVIKASSQAIDALVSVSSKFSKLKNPLLRKIMAPRVSLEQAAKMGGVRTNDLLVVLASLGFEIDNENSIVNAEEVKEKVPEFFSDIKNKKVTQLDVRPILSAGEDPLNFILKNIKNIKEGETVCIINTFEPTPLIHLLEKKGFESYIKYESTDEVHTYFHKNISQATGEQKAFIVKSGQEDFHEILDKYKDKILESDVRDLEMPLPMLTILELTERLPQDKVLYVNHKRIPVYLLPELENRGFEYFINEIAEGDVKLIIRHKI